MSRTSHGLPNTVLYYGTDEPLPERIELHAGPVTLIYEQGDLRYIQWGGHEIVRRIYVAIRDHNWGTVPHQFSDVEMENADDSFRITYRVENKQSAVHFVWTAEITGQPDGTIQFRMDGETRATFLRNRIGFCVLHPAHCTGKACRIEHTDGSADETSFPLDLCADQPVRPFGDMSSIRHEVQPGVWARLDFSGDVFEMEDQRNWTDASYKTYCTPLSIPYPAEIKSGTRITQSVTLMLRDERPATQTSRSSVRSGSSPIALELLPSQQPLPFLGLGVASHGQPLSDREIARLKALSLHHLRVDLWLSDPGYPARMREAINQAQALGIKLEVALFVSSAMKDELGGLQQVLDEIRAPITDWLVYPAKEIYTGGSPIDAVVQAARTHLAAYDSTAQFAAGTNTDYIFLQRNRPAPKHLDAVCFAINPQAHAFDNASVVETLEAQSMAVASARRLADGLPVIVSPVTLKPRFNPYATDPTPQVPAGVLPPQVDVRQMSLFCAGWTACSIASIATAGAQHITYYETTGWRGVMEIETGSPLPPLFRSLPRSVFPVYHVLADIGEFAGGRVSELKSSDPLRVNGLALRSNERGRVILSNFTPTKQHVTMNHHGRPVGMRMLDETHALEAMQNPDMYRRRSPEPILSSGEVLEIDLLPFAVATLDFTNWC